MVGRTEQIKNIIDGLTNYSGNHYSNIDKVGLVNAPLPKFLVIPNQEKHNNTNVYHGQFFRINLQADTLANLETMIDTILGLATDAANGYNPGTSELIHKGILSAYTDDVSRDNEDLNPLTGDTGRLTNDDYNAFMRFKVSPAVSRGDTLLNARLRLTPKNTVAENNPTWQINNQLGAVLDPSSGQGLSKAWWIVKIGSSVVNPVLTANWTTDVEQIITTGDVDAMIDILQEALDHAEYDGNLGLYFHSLDADQFDFYAKDSADSNPGKYPVLDLITVVIDSDYPYWIEFTVIRDPYDANTFKAVIECEARWGL